MARVGGKRPTAPGVKNKAGLTNLESKLLDSGLAKTPAEAKKLAKKLTAGLKQMGLLGKTPAQVLKKFQEKNGLKQTGTLDGPTQKALTEQGLLPKSAGPPGTAQDAKGAAGKAGAKAEGKAGEGAKADGAKTHGGTAKSGAKDKAAGGKKATDASKMERPGAGQKFGRFTEKTSARPQNVTAQPPGKEAPPQMGHRGVEVHQAQARAELTGPHEDGKQMQSLMSQLQGKGFGDGQPMTAKGMRESLRAFQQEHKLPMSGKMDEGTKAAMQAEGMLNPDGTPAEAKAQAEVVVTVQNAEGEGRAEGEGKDAGQEAGAAQSGQSPGEAADAEAKPQVIYGMGEMDVGYDDESGNAQSGDEDEDNEDRGHASIDDGEEHEEGHYRVPRLAVQIHAALDAIERDDDLTGAPTYAWDVTFYRPGVYGRRQKATPLWHIGISETGPFDPVWEQAHDALEQKLAEIEPESDAVNIYEFRMALRRARVRGQDEEPSSTYTGGG